MELSFYRRMNSYWVFTYGVDGEAYHLLPAGSLFALVMSPSPYLSDPHWLIRHYEAIDTTEGLRQADNSISIVQRKYRVVGGRALGVIEIIRYEAVIKQLNQALEGEVNFDEIRYVPTD